MNTLVIGHKNPDTDAICSALAYAELLRLQGHENVEAARCGEVTRRTQVVLDRAGLPAPRLVLDVRPTAGQICRRDVVVAEEHESLYETFNRLREHNVRSVPVVDSERRVKGLLSLQKAFDLLLPGRDDLARARVVESSLTRIARVLGGNFQNEVDSDLEAELFVTVAAFSAKKFTRRIESYGGKRLVVVVGDRPNVQRPAIAAGVYALVITGGSKLPPERLDQARKNQVNVILSQYDTATTTLMIKCAKPIALAMQTDLVAFEESTSIEDVRSQMQETTAQSLFPVLDSEKHLFGVLSRSNLLRPPAARLILVDHNELGQAVTGAEEAEIVEVLDHHRLGGSLISREPIRFVNEPVGSTCTLVARAYQDAAIQPTPGLALCMAAGIITDTLFLKSPTTTRLDIDILAWLGERVTMPLESFAAELFAAGSVLQTSTSRQAVQADCKVYEENGWRVGVAQIEEQSFDLFWEKKDKLRDALEKLGRKQKLDLTCLLVTDITHQNSVLLTVGNRKLIRAVTFPRQGTERDLFDLPGVVSRKKQLLPYLMRLTSEVRRR